MEVQDLLNWRESGLEVDAVDLEAVLTKPAVEGTSEVVMPVSARFKSSASRWAMAMSPLGNCWIQTASLVIPRRLREASYAALRSPRQQERIALRSMSVLPGNSGMANATACAVVI